MIRFKNITIKDKSWIYPLLQTANLPGCQHSFGNLFAWAYSSRTQVAEVGGYLAIRVRLKDGEYAYAYPAGSGDIKPVIEALIKDAEDRGHRFIFVGLSPENQKTVESLFPGKFSWQETRNDFDYVYRLDKMVSLSGRKLHSKRNHINTFKKQYTAWGFEIITKDNIKECYEMNEAWCKEQGCLKEASLRNEYCATQRFFRYFSDLGLDGGLIRLNGKVIAYTMGEVLNSDTYVIHIEKAFRDIQGAYPMINREFAAWVKDKYPHLVYVNREEDTGDEGLRKAKLSYRPVRLEVKIKGVLKDSPINP